MFKIAISRNSALGLNRAGRNWPIRNQSIWLPDILLQYCVINSAKTYKTDIRSSGSRIYRLHWVGQNLLVRSIWLPDIRFKPTSNWVGQK